MFEDKDWPGDFVGRTILGLTLDEAALHTDTELLDTLIATLPAYLNADGYLGPIYAPVINEQQLSGHGWLLRGLCTYYLRTHDSRVLPIVKSVAMNLFVTGSSLYPEYPVTPDQLVGQAGGASGSIASSGEK
ncbi:MAG: hypothetical protein HUK03_04090 [Bacteroidaceae bacterium]|nr:hypothetical protein [Bacteroidaceae bacterium]